MAMSMAMMPMTTRSSTRVKAEFAICDLRLAIGAGSTNRWYIDRLILGNGNDRAGGRIFGNWNFQDGAREASTLTRPARGAAKRGARWGVMRVGSIRSRRGGGGRGRRQW